MTCRKCGLPLSEGDEALVFDVERRITVSGKTVTFVDVVEYEHADGCPAASE